MREAYRDKRLADLESARGKNKVHRRRSCRGEPRRSRRIKRGVERALRSVPAPALRRAAPRPARSLRATSSWSTTTTPRTAPPCDRAHRVGASSSQASPPKDGADRRQRQAAPTQGQERQGRRHSYRPVARPQSRSSPSRAHRRPPAEGMSIAEPRACWRFRSCSTVARSSSCIFFAISLTAHALIQSDYQDIQDAHQQDRTACTTRARA